MAGSTPSRVPSRYPTNRLRTGRTGTEERANAVHMLRWARADSTRSVAPSDAIRPASPSLRCHHLVTPHSRVVTGESLGDSFGANQRAVADAARTARATARVGP